MTTAVIGATGRVGSEVVRGLLERGGRHLPANHWAPPRAL